MIALLILADATAAALPMPAFLSGCWEQKAETGRWTEECWTDTRGGVMIGSGRDGNGDKVAHWEWMRIERGGDGGLTFYGSPKGATPVGFTATANGLDAEVSLADGSKPNRWSYRRTGGASPK
jgi:hypothetical protein